MSTQTPVADSTNLLFPNRSIPLRLRSVPRSWSQFSNLLPGPAVDEDFQASSSDGGSATSDDSDAESDAAMSDASADKPVKKKQKTG